MDDPIRHECIDPDLGDELARLDDPETDEHLRRRLLAHCESCAACRFQLEFNRKVEAGLRDGSLRVGAGEDGDRWWQKAVFGGGSLALAAGLALILLLPPRAPEPGGIMRDESERPTIRRPVTEEVVGTTPTLRWTSLEQVTSYRVTVTSANGDYRWSEQTSESSIAVPSDDALPRGERFRAVVQPIPAHRAPEGGLRTTFHTGRMDQIAAYRLRHGPVGLWALVVLGALAVVGMGVRRVVVGRR